MLCILTLTSSKGRGKTTKNGNWVPKFCWITHSTLLFSTSWNVNSGGPYFVKTKEHSRWSFSKRTSISKEQWHEVSPVENSRKILSQSGILKTSSHLIAGARWESTTGSYELIWRKGIDWCSGKEINPFWCDINQTLELLGELFEAGY